MTFDAKAVLAIIAMVLGVIGYIPYVRDIFRRKTKPHVFTWLIWALLTGVSFAGQLSDHGGVGAYVTALTTVTVILVAVLSIKYGEKHITRSDWIMFSVSLATIPLWLLTKTPLYSMILAGAIETIAFLPTFRKSWHRPHEETLSLYILALTKFLFAIPALENYTAITLIYPILWLSLNSIFVLFLLMRRRAVRRSSILRQRHDA